LLTAFYANNSGTSTTVVC